MPKARRPQLRFWPLATSLPLSCVVATLALVTLETVSPYWGTFIVGAALSYVACDVALSFIVRLDPKQVRVLGHNLYTTKANGFWALFMFILVLAPTIVFMVVYAVPFVQSRLSILYPRLYVDTLLAGLVVGSVAYDMLSQIAP